MGGGGEKTTVGYKYYIGMHQALCHGPCDKIIRVRVGGKIAWEGGATQGTISIDKPELFGGEKKEGGISGLIDVEMGRPSQGQNSYLASKLGADLLPSFRGVMCAVLRQVYVGLNPYLKDWEWRVQRIQTRQDGIAQWYPEKAAIGSKFTETTYPATTSFENQKMEYIINTATPEAIAAIEVPSGGWDSEDPAPFGRAAINGGLQPVYPIETYWGNASSLWLKKVIAASGADNIVISGYVENAALFYLNGVLVGTVNANNDQSAAASGIPYTISIPPQYQYAGDNTLCILCLNEFPGDPYNPDEDNTYFYGVIQSMSIPHGYADMNPSHIIRECLTDPDWGMGYAEADADDDFFRAAANTLFSEGMGISLLWDQQVSIDDFIDDIIRHIDASLYVDRSTGKFCLKLIRADYVESELTVLDESNISSIDGFTRQSMAELVNEVTVNYFDIETGTAASCTLQNIALIQSMGAVVSATVDYPGFRNSTIASKVCERDLRSLSFPRVSCTIIANRSASHLNPGDCFLFSWEDYGVSSMVMRVVEIAYGDGVDNAVRIQCTQDTFATPEIAMIEEEEIAWESPEQPAVPAENRLVIEAPFLEIVRDRGQTEATSILSADPEAGFLVATCGRPAASTINADLYVDSGAGYADSGTVDFCPTAELTSGISELESVLPIQSGLDLEDVVAGTLAQIGNEIICITEISSSSLTVKRGCLDTIPAQHLAGDVVYFWQGFTTSDSVEYVESDELNVKLCPTTGSGPLALDSAPVDTLTMAGRANRPYPPANVKINDEYYPSEIANDPAIAVTWAHRDRIQQTGGVPLGWTDASVGPEAGVSYIARLLRADTLAELAAETGIGNPYVTLNNYFVGNLRLELWAARAGVESLYKWFHEFSHTPFAAVDDEEVCWKSGTVSGNVLLNDAEGLDTVSKVAGSPANVGVAVAGSSGGLFTVNANGSWVFDPNGDFDPLTGTQTATTSIGYHSTNGTVEAPATLTITVTAQNFDSLWDDVVFCINAAGADGSTTITDAKGLVVSRYGDTQIDTSLGYPAIQFDGTGDYATIPNSPATQIESGVFTYDKWIYIDKINARQGMLGNRPVSANAGCVIGIKADNKIWLFMTGGGSLTSTGVISAGLHHIEVSIDLHRLCRIFFDGALVGSGTVNAGAGSGAALQIGREQDGVTTEMLQARIPAMRLARGWRVRHVANFTPPQYPFGEAQESRYSASLAGIPDIVVWIDASDPLARDFDNGNWVVKNKCGSGADFAQDSAPGRPTLEIAAINGLDALRFDGGDYLYVPLAKVPQLMVNNAFTVFAVFKGDGAAGYEDFAMGSRVALYYDNISKGWLITANTRTMLAHTAHGEVSKTDVMTRGNLYACSWEIGVNAATPGLYVNGISATPTTNTISVGAVEGATGFLVIGQQGGSFMKGLLGELVCMSRIPTSLERTAIFDILLEKWGV